MGDRCSVYLQIAGKITRAQAEEIIERLDRYDMHINETGKKPTVETLGEYMSADEINYGRIEDITDYLIGIGAPYELQNDAGGGYGAGIERFDGIDQHHAGYDDGPLVSYSRILEVETLASGLATLIEEARFWCAPMGELEVVG